ncbi:MAG: site-specific integrase, partial [Fibromonadaceae bacterium]|nr:site-specific integrase [Fibromonadaceae bacterium]
WLENIRKTRSQNSARELVRLAKKFWEFGMERGAWKGLNPFNKKHLNDSTQLTSRQTQGFSANSPARSLGGGGRYLSSSSEKYLTPHQIQSTLACARDPETRAFWACCALAGLRQGEAAGLTLQQLSFGSGEWGVGSGGAKIVGLPARGNAPDFVEISEELHLILQTLLPTPHSPLPKNSQLFPNLPKHASQRTRDLQKSTPYSLLPTPLTFNLLRYSYGANLILQGADLETVRRKMRFAMLCEVVNLYGGLLG